MRIKITFTPEESFVYDEINSYFIHSFIWSVLRGTRYSALHNKKGFKFFTFSNIFPLSDFVSGKEKHLIISSPDEIFIKTLQENLPDSFRLGLHRFSLKETSVFNLRPTHVWQTATPIVLYKDNASNLYYSHKKDPDIPFFIERITENSIKKYNQFSPSEIKLSNRTNPIFDMVRIRRSVAKQFRKDKSQFVIIGTHAIFHIVNFKLKRGLSDFYRFLLDAGLGEKTSLGFGFVNPLRGE